MRLHCFECGKSVSTEVPDNTLVRGITTCPECLASEGEVLVRSLAGHKTNCDAVLSGLREFGDMGLEITPKEEGAPEKPFWFPTCPYPVEVFPMDESEYPKIVPDPNVRTALSGCLGRLFWTLASDAIWEAMQNEIAEQKYDAEERIRTDKPEEEKP